MNSLFKALCVSAVVVSVMGCATARVVSVRPGKGGVISISPIDSDKARAKAEALMQNNCNGKYTIVHEGEAVIGHRSTASAHKQKEPGTSKPILGGLGNITTGGTTVSKNRTTTQETEWRITYSCGPQ